jgi:hypothetical protein
MGEISSSSSPFAAAALADALPQPAGTGLLLLAVLAAALLSAFAGDVPAPDTLLLGLLLAPPCTPLLACADLSSSPKPAGRHSPGHATVGQELCSD